MSEQFGVTEETSRRDVLASLDRVSKRYGQTIALNNLDLEVRRGELIAVLGPNGAGKSTAISILLGLQQPDAGAARLFGQPPKRIQPRRYIGVMMQEVGQPPELTVGELIHLTSHYYPNPFTVEETIELAGIESIAYRRYGQLSGGQKRVTQFAMAICGRPKLLFLDEPTPNLDVRAREALWTAVQQLVSQGTAVLLTTHYIEEAEALADRVVVIAEGRNVSSGSVDDMRGLVVRKFIHCRTDLQVEEVAGWPEVEDATTESGRMRVATHDAEAITRRLLTSDAELRDLEVRRASLADALKLLTQDPKE
jgi:ABC-2 type transport system ATP-binding protein